MRIPGELSVIAEWCCCVFYTSLHKEKYSKKKTSIISAIFLILLLLFQQIQIPYETAIYEFHIYIVLLLTIIPILIFKLIPMLIFIRIVVKQSWKEVLFIFAHAFVTAEFLAAMIWYIYCLVSERVEITALWFEVLIIVVQLILYLIGLYKCYPKMYFKSEGQEVDTKMAILAVAVSYICFWIGNLWYFNFIEVQQIGSLLINAKQFICITVYFCGVLALFLMQRSMMEIKMAKEMHAITDMLNLRYQQYLDYMQNSEYISRQYHDLKHQIAGMRAVPGSEVWSDYLDELEGAVQKYQTWNVSGNNVLDAIMTQKKQYCIQHQIQLTCKADGKAIAFLFTKDICTIFGNILDNAIEAVSILENPDSRVIHGEICRKNDFLLIKFENCFSGNYNVEDQKLPITTKSNKANHGYGLKSIRLAVEKYNGSMNLQTENGWFIIKILIPVA